MATLKVVTQIKSSRKAAHTKLIILTEWEVQNIHGIQNEILGSC
jgi:hypothetical protein